MTERRQAEPWDIEPGVRVCIMMHGGKVQCGKVVRPLEQGNAAIIYVDGRNVTRDTRDIAVMLDEHGEVLHNPGRPKKWIQAALGVRRRRRPGPRKALRIQAEKKGALHRQLGVPESEKIPAEKLRWATKQPGVLGRRARLAMTLRGLGR